MSAVSIYLIRKETPDNSLSTCEDDMITIRREDNNIRISYRDRQNGIHTQNSILLTRTSLGSYIRNLGWLFLTDDQPFRSMQLNFPGFPSFMTTPALLKNEDTQAALVEIAEIVGESWFADYPGQDCECECQKD